MTQQVKEAETAFERQDEEIQALEQLRLEHQESLASNRNLIQLLKTELEKGIEKQKQLHAANERLTESEVVLTRQVADL